MHVVQEGLVGGHADGIERGVERLLELGVLLADADDVGAALDVVGK